MQSYLARKRETYEREWQGRQELATSLTADLAGVFKDGNRGHGPLNYLRIRAHTGQIADEYRTLLADTREYLEFARPPYAVDPIQEPMVRRLIENGGACRLLYASPALEAEQLSQLKLFERATAKVRLVEDLPMKLALFDNQPGDDLAGRPCRQPASNHRARLRAQATCLGDAQSV